MKKKKKKHERIKKKKWHSHGIRVWRATFMRDVKNISRSESPLTHSHTRRIDGVGSVQKSTSEQEIILPQVKSPTYLDAFELKCSTTKPKRENILKYLPRIKVSGVCFETSVAKTYHLHIKFHEIGCDSPILLSFVYAIWATESDSALRLGHPVQLRFHKIENWAKQTLVNSGSQLALCILRSRTCVLVNYFVCENPVVFNRL